MILVSASSLEYNNEKEIGGIPIFELGIGKINASKSITEIILKHNPNMIINFGSCGNLKQHKVGDILKVGSVLNDFEDFGLSNESNELQIDTNSPIKLFTTDHFYIPNKSYSDLYNKCIEQADIVDMEGFALSKICKDYNIPFHSYKWVSDDGNHNDWKENVKIGYERFKTLFIQEYMHNT